MWRLSQSSNQKPLTSEQQKAGQTTRLYDTIIQTKIIYQIDTIYKKVIIIQPMSFNANQNLGLTESKNTPSVLKANSDLSSSYKPSALGSLSDETKDNLNVQERITQTALDKSLIQNPSNAPKNSKNIEANTLNEGSKDLTTNNNSETTNYTSSNSSASALTGKQETIEETSDDKAEKQTMNTPTTNRQDTKILLDSIQNKAVVQADSLNNDLKSPAADTLKYAKVPFDSLELKPTESLQNIINKLPKKVHIDHYAVCLQGGASWYIPAKSGINSIAWYGAAAEMAFKNGLHLSVSFDNTQNHFKTTTRHAALNLPSDPPMTENYNLKYIEGSASSIQAGLGLSYLFQSERRIKPFVSVGYARRLILPYSLEFEFINKTTGEERSFKIDDKRYHQDNWFNMGLGLETTIESKFLLRLKTEYIYDPNHGLKGINQFLLRGGVFYKF